MRDGQLLRTSGVVAILGGACRTASALIPYTEAVWQVWLYLITDALLLFGLMGIYFAYRHLVGWFGLVSFAIAELGIASIVGPDTIVNGLETYMIGVAVITVGLTMFAIQLLLRRTPWLAPTLWLASSVAGIGLGIAGSTDDGFFFGGILFGLGFMAAGFQLVLPSDRVEQAP